MRRHDVSSDRRALGIGGSEVGALFNLDPYKTAFDVWAEKVGYPRPEPPEHVLKWFDRGRRLEPVIADMVADDTGWELRKGIFRRSSEHLFMQGTPDYLITDLDLPDEEEGAGAVLEIKHAALPIFRRILRDGWPKPWILQAHHYCWITGLDYFVLAALNAETWELEYQLQPVKPGIMQALLHVERRFWHDHVLTKTPPPKVEYDTSGVQEPPGELDTTLSDNADVAAAVEEYLEAKRVAKAADDAATEAQKRVKAALGKQGAYELENGRLRVYWRTQEGRSRFLRDTLEAACPIDRVKLLSELEAQLDEYTQRAITAVKLAMAAGELDVDFANYTRQGKPFDTLRVYDLEPKQEGPK